MDFKVALKTCCQVSVLCRLHGEETVDYRAAVPVRGQNLPLAALRISKKTSDDARRNDRNVESAFGGRVFFRFDLELFAKWCG